MTDLESGTTVSFRAPSSNSFLKIAGSHLLGFLAEEVGSKIFDSSVEFGVGKLTGATGLHIGKEAKFEEINEKLDEISRQIDDLAKDVNAGFLNGLIVLAVDNLLSIVDNLGIAQQSLQSLAANPGPSYTLEPDVFDHGPAVVPNATSKLIQSFSFFVTAKSLDVFQRALTSPSRSQNLLILANQKARQELSPQDQEGSAYDLRRDDLTRQLQSNIELFVGYCTQLANVISEAANAKYLPQGLSVPGFTPPSSSINEALADIVKVSLILFEGYQQVAEPVGSDLVLIDREHKLMWYLKAQLCKYDGAQNGMIDLKVNNWALPVGVDPPAPLLAKKLFGTSFINFRRPENLPGWRLPEREELRTLYPRVVALGEESAIRPTL